MSECKMKGTSLRIQKCSCWQYNVYLVMNDSFMRWIGWRKIDPDPLWTLMTEWQIKYLFFYKFRTTLLYFAYIYSLHFARRREQRSSLNSFRNNTVGLYRIEESVCTVYSSNFMLIYAACCTADQLRYSKHCCNHDYRLRRQGKEDLQLCLRRNTLHLSVA